jgi:phage tail sheath protein FI
MPEYLAPGVFVEEVSYRAKSIEGVSTTTTGFVGATRYGPIDIEPEIVTSLVEYERVYGGRQQLEFTDGGTPTDNYMWNAVRGFFEEGGKRLYVARAFNGDAAAILAACAKVLDSVPPLNVRINARFPGKAGEARVKLQILASQSRLTINAGKAVLAGVAHRDVVSITNFDTATPPAAAALTIGGTNMVGLFIAQRDIPNDTWTFTDEGARQFSLADLDSHPTVKIQVLTATVFVEPQSEGLPFFGAAGLALDRDHRSGGKPDSLFDYFAVQPASLSASRSIPIVIRALSEDEAEEENDNAVAAFNAAQLTHTPVQAIANAALITRNQAQIDLDAVPAGDDNTVEQTALNNAEVALVTANANAAITQAALDLATQIRDAASTAFIAAQANSEPSGLDFINGYVTGAATDNRFTLAHLIEVADPTKSDLVLDAGFFLTGGNDGAIPDQGAFAGKEDATTNQKSGLVALEDLEDISIVAAPGSSFTDAHAQSVANVLISHAQKMRYRIAVVDSIKGQSIAETRNHRAKFDSSYAAFYYPWVKIIDPETGNENHYPPSGFVSGIYARNDINRAVYKAPANEVVNLALGFEKLLNKSQQEVLNPEGVNCFRYFEGRGMRLWGARTMSSDPEWKYVNLRRYFAYLERSIDKGTQWAVFEPNGERLWANVKRTIEDFMLNEWMNGALQGDKPENSFFVKCDRSTMSQNDLDNGRLICQVGVSALRPAEFVIFRVGQWTADRKA